ncbi:hypothetical protein V4762_08820 [Thermodesulfobium sp. 4217-1]|uniref:hypothetical protein n=1 Tax=Thermodesulfobium sp. 4217-1 TaxID=3120013 RepID=UPI003221F6D2
MENNEFNQFLKKIESVEKLNKKIASSLAGLKNSFKNMNIKDHKKYLDNLSKETKTIGEEFSLIEEDLRSYASDVEGYIKSEQYPLDLDSKLKDEPGIKLSYPTYELGPIRLKIDLNQGNNIIFGRKANKIFDYKPDKLLDLLKKKYSTITKRPFNRDKFCKDLLEAYKILNKLTYQNSDVKWGNAVSLSKIYELITISSAYRQEYSKANFIFDISRLKDQFEIKFDKFQFNFGTSRDVANTLLVVDSNGNESRLSTLIVHKLED